MAFLMIRHRVENFERWKPLYDAHGVVRKQAGCKNEQLLQSNGDPNDLFILFEWDSLEHAKKFTQSQDLMETMKNAGVIGVPEFDFLEQIERKESGQASERKVA